MVSFLSVAVLMKRLENGVFYSKVSKYVVLDGVKYFNVASTNFLGFVDDHRVEVGVRYYYWIGIRI